MGGKGMNFISNDQSCRLERILIHIIIKSDNNNDQPSSSFRTSTPLQSPPLSWFPPSQSK
jgi:hypothetical protein